MAVRQLEVSPCYWQQNMADPEPYMPFDFSNWLMVRLIPDDLTPQQTLLELGLPPGPSLECRCEPDPRLARHYRILLVCPDADATRKEFERLSTLLFCGSLLEVLLVHDVMADLMLMELRTPHLFRRETAVALPGIALNFAYPEYLIHQLCKAYGEIQNIRRIILQNGEPSHTVVVTYGCLTAAYAAELALDGIPLDGSIVNATLMASLERRKQALMRVTQESG